MTTSDLHKIYVAGIGLMLLLGSFLYWRSAERHAGAVAILTHQSDSALTVQAKAAEAQRLVAVAADAKAVQADKAVVVEQRKDSLTKLHTDSVVRTATEERDRAQRLLVDSLATVQQLRAETVRLVTQSRADSAAFAVERTQNDSTVRALTASRDAERNAKNERIAAYNTQLQATLTAQREIGLLKSQQPGVVGKYGGWTVAALELAAFVIKK